MFQGVARLMGAMAVQKFLDWHGKDTRLLLVPASAAADWDRTSYLPADSTTCKFANISLEWLSSRPSSEPFEKPRMTVGRTDGSERCHSTSGKLDIARMACSQDKLLDGIIITIHCLGAPDQKIA